MTAEEHFQTFGKFEAKADALQLAGLFKKNNIEYLIEDFDLAFDPIFSSNKINREFRIKIHQQDFEKATLLIDQSHDSIIQQIQKVESSYYLFGFTDQELTDLVARPDEWSKHDFNLALSILKDRGKEISAAELENMKSKRIEELSKPESHHGLWIYLGYLSALLGGFFGIIIGWHLLTAKRTLPNQTTGYTYDAEGRKHGRFILILGLVVLITCVARAIILNVNS